MRKGELLGRTLAVLITAGGIGTIAAAGKALENAPQVVQAQKLDGQSNNPPESVIFLPNVRKGYKEAPSSLVLGCPVPSNLCSRAKVIEIQVNNMRHNSLEWRLPPYVPIFAVFDGVISEKETVLDVSNSARFIRIVSLSGKYEARYLYLPQKSIQEDILKTGVAVKKGDLISIVPGIPFEVLGDPQNNFRFELRGEGDKEIELKPEDLGNLTLP